MTLVFNVELLPAGHGDCIWIKYGNAEKTHHILIDGGPTPTWDGYLKQKLLDHDEIQLLVLTHIDADHIAGAIPMLDEARDVTFRDVWFNGWQHLSWNRKLSTRQGEVFSKLLMERNDPWNKEFAGGAVCVTDAPFEPIVLPGDMRLTILSPTLKELSRLKQKWHRHLSQHGFIPGQPHQHRRFLARAPNRSTDVDQLATTKFRSDRSAPNASSIAFLAEFDRKSVLFTGDAFASVLTRTITRLLDQRERPRLELDALKVPHHGSRGNINLALLQMLDCRQFWFSSNGDIHQLPDNEAIGRIIHTARREIELVFNYDCPRTEVWKSKELQKRYNYTTRYGESGHVEIALSPRADGRDGEAGAGRA